MIGKQFKRHSFRQVLGYVSGKERAEYLGGNMSGQTVAELTAEFRRSQELNPSVLQPAYHVALSLPHQDHLDETDWQVLAADYLERMGYGESQYVLFRHADRDHVHLVASRVRLTDGKLVPDSWDYHRSQAILRQLEQEYQLTATLSSWEVGDSTINHRPLNRGEVEKLERTGEKSIRQQLQEKLTVCAEQSQTLPEYLSHAQSAGIQIKLRSTPDGGLGISYQLDGVALSGTHLGKDYTFNGLQKRRGLTYEPSNDPQEIERLLGQVSPNQEADRQDILSIAIEVEQEERTKQQQRRSRSVSARESRQTGSQQQLEI
jgi:Relaxase/Mobilisation nuclease domain